MRSKYSQFTLCLGMECCHHFMRHPITMRSLHQRGFRRSRGSCRYSIYPGVWRIPRSLFLISSIAFLAIHGARGWVLSLCKRLQDNIPGERGKFLHKFSLEQQQDIFVETLRGWFEKLRSLPPPDERVISGVLGGGFFSFGIGDISGESLGPYPSQHEF